MIKIFNRKLDSEIIIDDSVDWIQFNPRHYQEKPFVNIEFKNFSFPHHALNCEDCKKFMKSFGSDSVDWYISFSKKTYRLDMSSIGSGDYPFNEVKVVMSEYNPGTKMTLIFHELPVDKEELRIHLTNAVEIENYEKACIIRDLINEKH